MPDFSELTQKPKATFTTESAAQKSKVVAPNKPKRFQLAYRISDERHRALQLACIDKGIKMQTLINEAVDLWLDANGIEQPD